MSHAAAVQGAAVQATSGPGGAASAQRPAAPSLSEPTVSPGPTNVRELTVRIAAPDTPAVDVQVNQRQGQVYVAVRTADPALQTSLRQDLPQLVNSLDRAGFRTETFIPHASGQPTVSSAAETSLGNSTPDSSPDSKHDSGRDSPQDSSRQPPSQQQQQQRQREQMHNRWLDQMEG